MIFEFKKKAGRPKKKESDKKTQATFTLSRPSIKKIAIISKLKNVSKSELIEFLIKKMNV
jgi:hypothetical protein